MMQPEEEFADALISFGLILEGSPDMSGRKQRVPVEGDKKGQLSGLYIGYLDGYPAGFIKNYKTGAEIKWKAKAYVFDPVQKDKFQAEAKEKMKKRQTEKNQLQEQVAERVRVQLTELMPVENPTPYMTTKGIKPQPGAFTDQSKLKTYIPTIDTNCKQWTMQYILEDGTKRFAKDSRKQGCFHAVGGMEALVRAPALVIAEGYATAASLSEALGFSTVAAFDAGNIEHVAVALQNKFPGKPVVIAGDDDRVLMLTQGANPGKSKALEAAKATNGKVMLPIFALGENCYPGDLEPITPELFKRHLNNEYTLSHEQLAALNRMKGMTDFNDLANKSSIGKEGMRRQVTEIIKKFLKLNFEDETDPPQHAESQHINTVRTNKFDNLIDVLDGSAWAMVDSCLTNSNPELVKHEAIMKKKAAVAAFNVALRKIDDALHAQQQHIQELLIELAKLTKDRKTNLSKER